MVFTYVSHVTRYSLRTCLFLSSFLGPVYYAMHEQGLTNRQIADTLNAEGIPGKRGGRWYPATIRYMLDNPKYQGQVEYLFKWGGEAHIEQAGQHEAILPKAG